MRQTLMGHTLPAEAAGGDATVDMGPDESVLILVKHCRDMKQQETRLRLITLLLLLSCTALFVFAIGADLRRHRNSGSSGQGSAVGQSPAYSRQERVCPAATEIAPTNLQRLHIHLRSMHEDKGSDGLYIKWDVMFGENYNTEERAVVIPVTGFYFVYVWTALSCHDEGGAENFQRFYVELQKWNEGYNKTVRLAEARDGIACTSEGSRSVFVGQLFDLLEGDHVKVWIGEGYKLITKSSFGLYLT